MRKLLHRAGVSGSTRSPKGKKGGKADQRPLILAFAAVMFCWLLGIPSLVMGALSVRAQHMQPKSRTEFGWAAAWAGTILGLVFSVYYAFALAYGAHFTY